MPAMSNRLWVRRSAPVSVDLYSTSCLRVWGRRRLGPDSPAPTEIDGMTSGVGREVDADGCTEAGADTADGGTDSEALAEAGIGVEGDLRDALGMTIGSSLDCWGSGGSTERELCSAVGVASRSDSGAWSA